MHSSIHYQYNLICYIELLLVLFFWFHNFHKAPIPRGVSPDYNSSPNVSFRRTCLANLKVNTKRTTKQLFVEEVLKYDPTLCVTRSHSPCVCVVVNVRNVTGDSFLALHNLQWDSLAHSLITTARKHQAFTRQ